MLATVYHHLGDSWKWAREGANFAAVLFYNSIFRVSKWFFFSQIPTPQNLCISQVTYLACRQHDSRKDHLLRNPDLLTAATIHDSDSSVSKPRPRLWRECNALCNSHRGRNLRLGRLS